MFTEQKIGEGIYISKPSKANENQDNSITNKSNMNIVLNNENEKKILVETDYKEKVLAKSRGELISIYENDFYLLEFEVQSLFEANEEMLRFNPNDYDLIEARQENLIFINKKLSRMKEIQGELTNLCPSNPICKIDIFGYFSQKEDKNDKNKETTSNVDKKAEKTNNITEEIDL